MARRMPPSYPVDGDAIYIPSDDTAWDHERIERERAEYDAKGATHPYDEYRSGQTRSRIEPIQEYLDMGKNPEQWILEDRHFPPRIRREIGAILSRGIENIPQAFYLAFKWGVKDVKSSPFKLKRMPDGSLADMFIAELDQMAPGIVDDIGGHIYYAIQPLSDAEGK